MTDLRERLRAADKIPVPELLTEARRRAQEPGEPPSWGEAPRGGRLVAGLVAFAVFIGGSVLAARVFLGSEPLPSPSANPWTEVGPGWTQLAPPPFERSDSATAWTGSELIVWGGGTDYNANFFADGAIYDPEANEWRAIADGPLEGRAEADAVWTGSEVLVWGGFGRPGPFKDGAAYDPGSDTWRSIPEVPLELGAGSVHVWTGRELIVLSSLRGLGLKGSDAAAYDPESDSWRRISSAPLGLNAASGVWTGSEAVFYGAYLTGRNISATEWAQGMTYDPTTDAWRVLPEHQISPQASWASWTGREMLVWDYDTSSALYDPATDTWREPNAMPIEFSECYPYSVRTNDFVFAWFCGQMALFDIQGDTWTEVEPGPVQPSQNDPLSLGEPVGAGEVVMLLLSRGEGNGNSGELSEMWAYRPG